MLNISTKVYEIVLKNKLSALSDYMSPFISAYRKGYSTQHVLVRLVEEWQKYLDNEYIVGGFLMDLFLGCSHGPVFSFFYVTCHSS